MKRHFAMMAAYNRWANARVYAMAAALPDALFKKPVGLYFGSLHATLNHLLVADRIWMHRLDNTGDHPGKLNAIIHEDLPSLRNAREAEDRRIVNFVDGLDAADFEKMWPYRLLSGVAVEQPIRDILAHLFNHQTHHRGQAHAALTLLGTTEPESLDLLIMQREKR